MLLPLQLELELFCWFLEWINRFRTPATSSTYDRVFLCMAGSLRYPGYAATFDAFRYGSLSGYLS